MLKEALGAIIDQNKSVFYRIRRRQSRPKANALGEIMTEIIFWKNHLPSFSASVPAFRTRISDTKFFKV